MSGTIAGTDIRPNSMPPSAEDPPEYEQQTPGSNPKLDKVRLPRNIAAVKDPKSVHPKGRTLVVCLDGTGDKFDSDNSNIVQFVECLKKDDASQATYYQAGIGTYSRSGLQGGFSAAMDMAVGSELGLHVRDAYDYLMHTYKEGDKICLLGFSRGAYTARCLAGMIHKVGLLPPRNIAQIPFAYEFYKDDSLEGWKQSFAFKKTFCIDVNVHFIGVFDSVASVGFIPRQLPLANTPSNKPHYFRHAMALDERRAKFKPCRYQAKDWADINNPQAGVSEHSQQPGAVIDKNSLYGKAEQKAQESQEIADNKAVDESEFAPPEALFNTDAEEVWFVGAHADVGGGAMKNEERHKLSHISLRWMIRQCFECETGILFKTRVLAELGMDIHTLWPKYLPMTVPDIKPTEHMMEQFKKGLPPKHKRSKHLTPINHTRHGDGHYDLKIAELEADEKNVEWLPEQVEDWFDAQAQLNDELTRAKTWWILEFYPVEYKMQRTDSDEWDTIFGMNLGRYRGVPDKAPKMHWTVKARMESTDYEMLARSGREVTWTTVA